ncbi:MAG: 1,4-alpha-glucan branching protein GlgB [Firmicutes bacterium]|nr:1,4-alpha-glucan branching protein GlgB [Bacillota bacterium]
MLYTADLVEIQSVVNAVHGDPHHVLGMHEMNIKGEDCLVVRCFMPHIKSVAVYDPEEPLVTYPMEKIHSDGFFEVKITERTKWFRYKFKVTNADDTEWTSYDAYSFEPQISDLDMHLFNQGTHYEIYNKLGAHLMTIDGVNGAYFAVWAPNAKRVSVIGDFNEWDGRRHTMRLLQHSGIWEIFIPGIVSLDKYKFEIKTGSDAIIEKTDPYENYAELRPSTTSLVYDINKYRWNDQRWFEKLKNEDKYAKPINIYEVHLGSWKRVKSEDDRFLKYSELTNSLIPYVKEMGYTHIELMPIEEYPFDGSWGYQVTGYFAPTSRYGDPEEFMEFIDRCHQEGIGVILDWVPAHFPKDSNGLIRFDGTSLYEHADPRKGEHKEWGTMIFNYGRNEVKNFLIANALFWLDKYHLDGLRVDAVASMLYLDYGKKDGEWVPNEYGGRENNDAVEFLKHLNSIVSEKFPEALMIAEESTAWQGVTESVHNNGLGFDLKWNMGWMNDFLEYVAKDPVHRKYHHNNLTFGMMYAYNERFELVLSHDEVVHGKKSMLDKMPGDRWQKFANLRVSYGFMYGHPGKKLLFMGGEFGQFIEWNEKQALDWFLLGYDLHQQMQDYVKDLNHLYKDESALWEYDFSPEGFEWIDCDDADRSIFSFIRKGKTMDDTLIFVCNFTPNSYETFKLGVPYEGCYKEILNSDDSKYGGSGIVNPNVLWSQKSESHKRYDSIWMRVPPLGVSILKKV